MILARIILCVSLASHLLHKVTSTTTIVNPPDPTTIQPGCPPANVNSNVLQNAINNAAAGDTIQLTAGAYYFECNVAVTKPLTILGACSGLPPNPSGGTRDGCTAESIIFADSSLAPNGLYGIMIESSDVTIDGLFFQEATGTTDNAFRSMIAVLADSSTFNCNGSYSNIIVRNNYMKGTKASSVLNWGGTNSSYTCTINDLLLEDNVLIVTKSSYDLWEPISFRGGSPFSNLNNGTITLNNFQMIGNNITCAPSGGGHCNVLNIANNHLDLQMLSMIQPNLALQKIFEEKR